MASLTNFIEKRLKLKVNAEKSKVARPHACKFLGLKLHRLKTGEVRVLVADKALQEIEQELKARTPRNWGQSLDACIQHVNVLLRGWIGYFGICDEKHLARLGKIDGHLRRRLRAILLKQWKRKRYIVNRLMRMGVPGRLARVDIHVKRRSWWALSKARAVCRGLTNEFFDRQGLFSLRENWRQHHERIWDIGPKQLPLLKGKLG
jgi:hypothetical protein